GVSLHRMAAPVAIIGVLVSGIAISFNEWVSPIATEQKNQIYDAAIRSGVPSNRPVYFEKEVVGQTQFILRADNYDSETKKLVHPTIIIYLKGKPVAIEWADSGTWQGGMNWDLRKGFGQQFSDSAGGNHARLDFEEQPTNLGVSIDQLLTASQDPNALTYAQLAARVESKIKEGRTLTDINTDRVTLYSKISIPFASLIFALIGFPLGIRRQRSGGAIGFALSIAIIFIYYLIYQYASILGNNGAAPPLLCAWIPDIVGLLAGLALLRKASI
nr:LptF/LptG family permease [Armatimonadota bacterium]